MPDEATTIGTTIVITGNLRGDEDLLVLGRVEGYVNLTRTLTVAEGGIVKAEISVHTAVISGIVVGNIAAADCIHITATGRILGDIRAKRVILNAGARVRGDIDVGSPAATTATRPALTAAAVEAHGGPLLAAAAARGAAPMSFDLQAPNADAADYEADAADDELYARDELDTLADLDEGALDAPLSSPTSLAERRSMAMAPGSLARSAAAAYANEPGLAMAVKKQVVVKKRG